ncbi:Tda2 protein [Maudiozyma humilis]|uniref:Topoisomerase I damage affected protein 2 n=1 Tax=Maudiozyma humilis TaxID=51915 RepID=A0AAV5RY15_MAUHU|nr:Tda2 protein [Kazachstania humilis]
MSRVSQRADRVFTHNYTTAHSHTGTMDSTMDVEVQQDNDSSRVDAQMQQGNNNNALGVDVEVQPGKDNSPLERTELQRALEAALATATAQEDTSANVSRKLKEAVLEALRHNSSQYKYIVSVTALARGTTDGANNDFKLANDVGALWSAKKDGLVNFALEDSAAHTHYLITVFYIFK